jgi:sterol desaturase/sphingolipid hydroxylase (fatty acid hydroxylase superfamily)
MAVSLDRRKLVRAIVASAAAGAVIYLLVMQWALPAVQTGITHAQVEWLRDAMKDHLVAVLFAIVAITALLGLPVLMVFRWAYGPMVGRKQPSPDE